MGHEKSSHPNRQKSVRTLKFSTAIICLSLCLSSMIALAGEGERLLDKFIVETKTMSANFSQSLRTSDGELLQESTGQFYLQKPGRFRWNYMLPYAQEIVSDGENIWIYDVDLQQVTVQKQSIALSNTPMALIQDKISVDAAFDIKPLDEKNGVYRLLLASKSETTDFKNIILGVSENGLQFMQLKDQFDQDTDIVFSDTKVNGEIDSATFIFKAPEGTDIFGGN